MNLENKVAIVTGASRDIGRAIALELAQRGAGVVVNYHRNAEVAVTSPPSQASRARESKPTVTDED